MTSDQLFVCSEHQFETRDLVAYARHLSGHRKLLGLEEEREYWKRLVEDEKAERKRRGLE